MREEAAGDVELLHWLLPRAFAIPAHDWVSEDVLATISKVSQVVL